MKRVCVKKLLALMLILLASLPAVWAGGRQATSAVDSGAYVRDPNLNPPGTNPIHKNTVPLRIGVQQNIQVTDWETNWQTQLIERLGNYDLSFDVYPAGEMPQRLELMVMAGGADLPDILFTRNVPLASITRYGQAGMIIPTNKYFENSAYYINQAKDLFKEYDPLRYVTSPDGNVYGVWYAGNTTNSDHCFSRIYMYEPWLNKLGLAAPQNTDELLNVLRAFRDRDPNGNGIKDEIPLLSNRNMMTRQNAVLIYALMQPFIYTQPDYWMVDGSGKIDVAFNKPGWRDGLRYIKQLIDEGLLSPLSFTQDSAQMIGLITPDPAKVGGLVWDYSNGIPVNDRKRSEYAIVTPIAGPDGRRTLYFPEIPTVAMVISKNCKTPESAFMLGDLLISEEMSLISRYGERGVDWIEPQAPENRSIIEGVSILVREINPIWGTAHNKHWAAQGPRVMPDKLIYGDIAGANPDDPFDYTVPVARRILTERATAFKNPIAGLVYTEEEQEIMTELHQTIITYVHESFARFVTGDLSIDRDWDRYVAEFDRMGLADIIQATQACWDRMNQ